MESSQHVIKELQGIVQIGVVPQMTFYNGLYRLVRTCETTFRTGKLKTWSLTTCIGWKIQWHLNHYFDHITPPPWKHCIFYWSGRPKKGCVCTAEWVHRHHGNSTADVWRAEQKTSRTALRDLPRGSLQCLQRLTLHREKSSIDLVGRLIFVCQLLKCSGSGCSFMCSLFNLFMSWFFTSPPKPQMSSPFGLAPAIGTWQCGFFVPWNWQRQARHTLLFGLTFVGRLKLPVSRAAKDLEALGKTRKTSHVFIAKFCLFLDELHCLIYAFKRFTGAPARQTRNHWITIDPMKFHELSYNICTHFDFFLQRAGRQRPRESLTRSLTPFFARCPQSRRCGVSMVWSITWFHSWTSIPVGRMFSWLPWTKQMLGVMQTKFLWADVKRYKVKFVKFVRV